MDLLTNLLGGYLVGTILVAILLGATTVQAWLFFSRFPADGVWIKVVILTLMATQMLNLGCLMATLWPILVQLTFFVRPTWLSELFLYSTVISSTLVHFFFINRIKRMKKWPWLALIIATAALCTFGFGMRTAIAGTLQDTVHPPLTHSGHDPGIIGWCTFQAVTDLLIAGSMIVHLQSVRTGFPQTDRALNLMVLYAISTGLVTSLLALAVLFAFTLYTRSMNFFFICITVSLGGVYTGTLLANLHARTRMRLYLQAPPEGFRTISVPPSPVVKGKAAVTVSAENRNQFRHTDEGRDDRDISMYPLSGPSSGVPFR